MRDATSPLQIQVLSGLRGRWGSDPQVLWEDGGILFCRGWRAGRDGDAAKELIVVPVAERPSPGLLERLAHEYELEAELDREWAARPLELVREHGRFLLVLADPGGEPLVRLVGNPLEVGTFLRLAIGVGTALARVHQRGLIHKDLKPAHILWDRASGHAWLTGFGLASRLPREHPAPETPETIAGTLAYMAPERTGRMNRSVDARSDLYSLGATFYELLTGRLPFTAADPMELVFSHIARSALPPTEHVRGLPEAVSGIVMRLLAKTAEERYQTAAGLAADLSRCLAGWEEAGRVEAFPLGTRDIPEVLRIPEKLYGREQEVGALLAAFERVASGGVPELVLVSGYSGIGKSSVVNELHRVIVPPRGLFASGKFDQYQRDIPYATLAQAFQGLVRQLLVKSEEELAVWRQALLSALGPNGRLVEDLAPELGLLIGPQPPVPELPVREAENRFLAVLEGFLGVFARPEHPLVLFLDDLQWLDAATLKFLAHVVSPSRSLHLLAVGAYRDNEVGPTHPLTLTLEAARKAGALIEEIVLGPLSAQDTGRLVGDSVGRGAVGTEPLGRLVQEKTAGNPFFAIQFLGALVEDRLLDFDAVEGSWSWDLEEIRARGFTNDVVDLMVAKLRRLPLATRAALQQFACLGNAADVTTLALVAGETEAATHAVLAEAVRDGIVLRGGDSYRFVHDRVQEAAYTLIPEDRRTAAHVRIGRLLLSRLPPETVSERVFDIVNQLNHGVGSIMDAVEEETLGRLNALAGRRAKAAIAYASARRYLAHAAALLPADGWARQYEDTFALQLERAECEYITGNVEIAETLFGELLEKARDRLDSVRVHRLRMEVYELSGHPETAAGVMVEALELFGVCFPEAEEEIRAATEAELRQIPLNLGDRAIAEVVDSPPATDAEIRTIIGLLAESLSASYMARPALFPLLTARAVNLSLRYGNTEESCASYSFYALLLAARFEDIDSAYQFSEMAVRLNEKFNDPKLKGRALLMHASTVALWRNPLETTTATLRQAFRACLDVGDLIFGGYAAFNICWQMMERGETVAVLLEEVERYLNFARESHNPQQHAFLSVVRTLLLRLSGRADAGDGPGEPGQWLRSFLDANDRWGLAIHHTARLVEAFTYARIDEALSCAEDAGSVRASMQGTAVEFSWTFYHALTLTAAHARADGARRQGWAKTLNRHIGKLRIWAEACPQTFGNRRTLVLAEVARSEGRQLEAMQLYEQAIHLAREGGFIQIEALANELAGRFYLDRGLQTNGYAHLRDALDCYALWGADSKVTQLERSYPRLAGGRSDLPAATVGSPLQQLDATAVARVSRAVSAEIELPRLIETLMRIALQNAGADRGLLLLPRGEEHSIAAEARATGDRIEVGACHTPLGKRASPETLLRYVIRTQQSVIVDDAAKPGLFSDDEYLRYGPAKSILCLPLVGRGRLAGLLYLENTLTSHAFTSDRIAVLELLAAQAAISLENTRLYCDLQQREAKIRRLVDSNIIGIIISGLEGQIIEANDAFLDLVGYTREELVEGRCLWTEMTPPEWLAASQRAVDQIRATGTCEPFEKEYFRRDGSRVPVLVGAAAFEGERTESVAFVLDLTESKRAEEERHAHMRFLESMDRVNRAIQGTDDLEQMMSEVLDAVLEIFAGDRAILATFSGAPEPTSFSVAMVRARPEFPSDLVPGVEYPADEDLAAMIRTLRTAAGPAQFGPGSEHPLPARVRERLGHHSVLCTDIYAKRDTPHQFYHFSLAQLSSARVWTTQEVRLFQEIGRRLGDALNTLSMYRNLRQSETRLEEAQRLAHLGYWERDLDTDRFTVSDETYRIIGLEPQERTLTFAEFEEWIHPEDQHIRMRAMSESLQGGTRIETEYRVVRSSGEVRTVQIQGNAIRDESGRLQRTFGTIQDVTEQRMAEEALRKAQAELAHIARVMTVAEIGSSIAHEVNQPLAAIMMSSNACRRWLEASPPDLDEARTAVQAILTDAQRASVIIGRIRAPLRRGDTEKKRLSVPELIRDTLALVRMELSRREVTLQIEVPPDLPEVVGDRVQLQQVLVNLILNGRDAMEGVEGSARLLTIRSHRARTDGADALEVEVQDSGRGLDPEHPDRIFEPFFSTKPGGLGVGLSISRSIVEAHGGRLWATRNQGSGATLHFSLPLGLEAVP